MADLFRCVHTFRIALLCPFPTATLDRLTLGFGSQHCLGLRLSLRLRLLLGFRTRALFRAGHVGSEQYLGEQALPHTRPSRPRPACAGYPVCRPLCSVCLNYLSNCFSTSARRWVRFTLLTRGLTEEFSCLAFEE